MGWVRDLWRVFVIENIPNGGTNEPAWIGGRTSDGERHCEILDEHLICSKHIIPLLLFAFLQSYQIIDANRSTDLIRPLGYFVVNISKTGKTI